MESIPSNLGPFNGKYRSYLLCLWQENGRSAADNPEWFFSLEDPVSGVRVGFRNLEAFVLFLESLVVFSNSNIDSID
jgi:hypothetical protein